MTFLSIVIPVYQDTSYVSEAIASVLDLDSRDVQLLVSLNDCTGSQTASLRRQFPSIRIVQAPHAMTMAEHFEWCLRQIQGDWMTILGSDDVVLPNLLSDLHEACQIMENVLAVSWQRILYFWPGVEDVYQFQGGIASWKYGETTHSGLVQVVGALFGRTAHHALPQMYTNNVIHRKLYNRSIERSGSYFYERHPDVSSGVLNALTCGRFLRFGHPAFITGTSNSSSGLAIARQQNTGVTQERAIEFLQEFDTLHPTSAHLQELNARGYSVSSSDYIASAIQCLAAGVPWRRTLRVMSTGFLGRFFNRFVIAADRLGGKVSSLMHSPKLSANRDKDRKLKTNAIQLRSPDISIGLFRQQVTALLNLSRI